MKPFFFATPISNSVPVHHSSRSFGLSMFTPLTSAAWVFVVLLTVLSEVIPIPILPRVPFYTYVAAKATLFSAVGYLIPLTFLRFNALNRGIVFAFLSAILVEGTQSIFRHGHSFHWYELVGKLALILLGFALALDVRYEKCICLGPLRIHLIGENP